MASEVSIGFDMPAVGKVELPAQKPLLSPWMRQSRSTTPSLGVRLIRAVRGDAPRGRRSSPTLQGQLGYLYLTRGY